MSIVVFGSLNVDLVMRVPRLPLPGETLTGFGFDIIPGGKGANQAVAAARLGVPTAMVGCLGGDRFGELLLATLQAEGIDCQGIRLVTEQHSGVAAIAVAASGENQILLAPGSNGCVGEPEIAQLRSRLTTTRVLLLQLEIPLPAVITAAQLAYAAGVTVILDPAPAQDLPPELYPWVSLLTPNQTEATQLTDLPITTLTEAETAARQLQARGTPNVVITLGAQGALAVIGPDCHYLSAHPVSAIDTTAAGDAFNGAVAAALVQGHGWPEALHWGTIAGAIATTKPGAQPSLPTAADMAIELSGGST